MDHFPGLGYADACFFYSALLDHSAQAFLGNDLDRPGMLQGLAVLPDRFLIRGRDHFPDQLSRGDQVHAGRPVDYENPAASHIFAEHPGDQLLAFPDGRYVVGGALRLRKYVPEAFQICSDRHLVGGEVGCVHAGVHEEHAALARHVIGVEHAQHVLPVQAVASIIEVHAAVYRQRYGDQAVEAGRSGFHVVPRLRGEMKQHLCFQYFRVYTVAVLPQDLCRVRRQKCINCLLSSSEVVNCRQKGEEGLVLPCQRTRGRQSRRFVGT